MAEAQAQQAASESPAPAPASKPEPAAPEPTKFANESKRFEQPADPFAGVEIPEKFRKDGKPDLASMVTSYTELERRMMTKTDELKEQIKGEMFADRPEKPEEYKLPELEGVEIPADSPLVDWWRKQAHTLGLGQEGFEAGVKQYIERAASMVDLDAERAKLGDNAEARIEAVATWVESTFTDPAEIKALEAVASSAAGIKVLERLMGGGKLEVDAGQAVVEPQMTVEKLREMQNDPRYWNPSQRDPAFVRQVEEGYNKLYGG